MIKMTKILAGAGLVASVAVASPAAAQYGYRSPNPVGQIISNVLGYGQYPYGNYGYGQGSYRGSERAVNQCARAVESRLNGGYGGYVNNRGARVLGIDRVEVRNNGRLRVTGVATSGRNYNNPFGYGRYNYNRQYGVPDLRFNCRADSRGRVFDVNIDRYRFRSR